MKSIALLSIIPAFTLLAACSSGSDADRQKARAQDRMLLEAARKPLDQARQVEKQLQDAAEARRQEIEEQSE